MKEGYFAEPEDIMKYCSKVNFEEVSEGGGVPVLTDSRSCYILHTDSNVLLAGSPGSGKTQSVIIPTILTCCNAKESMVVNVTKSEVIDTTANYLERKGYKVFCINFRNPLYGHCYDLLGYAKKLYSNRDSRVVNELFSLGESIFEDIKSSDDPYWDRTSISLFVGLTLCCFMMYDNLKDVSILSVYQIFSQGMEKVGGSLVLKEYINQHEEIDDIIKNILNPILSSPSDTLQSVCSVFSTGLIKYISNVEINDMLSHSDFKVLDLQKEPTCVFIVNKDENNVYKPIIASIVDSLYDELTECAEERGGLLDRRVNYILEEFSSLHISNMSNKISVSRGRNIRFYLCIQNFNQLETTYGTEAKTILGCCNTWIYLYSPEYTMNELFAKRIGTKINDVTGREEYCISPSQLQFDMKKGDAIFLLERCRPFKSHLFCVSQYEKIYGLNLSEEYVLFKRKIISRDNNIDIKEMVEVERKKHIEQVLGSVTSDIPELFSFSKAIKIEEAQERELKISEIVEKIDAENEKLEQEMECTDEGSNSNEDKK
ncbi:MAG: type IV secretory system conjugative DNA transfer family protein [Lachnospiraceae bacterium]|nr:type IV secretory system conjugative DNA transfer family protein [Lachnospiraceae bacterium]